MELFKNSHDALIFALRFSGQQYAQSQLAKNMKASDGKIGQGRGLVALDGAGQAGLIRSRLEQLNVIQQACIVARFSSRTETCPCCENQKKLAEYKAALMVLAEWAGQFVPLESCVHRLRFGIVESYFDKKTRFTEVAQRVSVSRAAAYDYRAKVFEHLAKLDDTALELASIAVEDMCGEIGA